MNIQKLRDMNLRTVADELEQLREFKAKVESQGHRKPIDPVQALYDEVIASICDSAEKQGCVVYTDGRTLLNKLNADREQVPAVAVPDCLKYFVDHDFHQLPVYDDGRTPLLLTEEQYNAIQNLLAAPSSSQQSAEVWQPIETAPIDKDILVVCNNFGEEDRGKHFAVVRWDDEYGVFADANLDRDDDYDLDVSGAYKYATHWMPVPKPPSSDRRPAHDSEQGGDQ